MPLHKAQPAATARSPALPVVRARDQEVDDPTGVQVIRKERFEKPICSTSARGLLDLVTHVNKPTTVYTRQYSVSLPLGLGILPYGSNPTADSSPPDDMESLIGQFMVEIFEVAANFPFVGTIMVCDEYSSKTIYETDDWDQPYYDFCSRRDKWVSSGNAAVDFKHKLELTGSSRATTADEGFIIKVYIPATKRKAREICRRSWDTNNVRLHNKLKTHSIKTNRGSLYVTCSVLPEAMQGYVEVLLQLPKHWRGAAGAAIYGLITARIEKFAVGSTLFRKDLKEAAVVAAALEDGAVCSEAGYSCVRVPLTRSILAVPLEECLHVEGKLQVCGYDAMPITIDHRIPIDYERVRTPWIKSGESLSSVGMWLSYIF